MAVLYPFSERVARLLAAYPPQGQTHMWLPRVAAGLRDTFDAERCLVVLKRICLQVRHREIPEREIREAVSFAYGAPRSERPRGCSVRHGERRRARTTFDWPDADEEVMEQIMGSESPAFDPTSDVELSAGDALIALFDPEDLICAGPDQMTAMIRPVEETVLDAALLQFVVPNPMRGLEAVNKAGKPSKRCQANVRERRFLVTEFDLPGQSHRDQACLIGRLKELMPLVMVVDSGGKSLHAWFFVHGVEAGELARFFGYACCLGADPSRWDPCGWLRMPGGLRRRAEGQPVRQRIVFFAPAVLVDVAATGTEGTSDE